MLNKVPEGTKSLATILKIAGALGSLKELVTVLKDAGMTLWQWYRQSGEQEREAIVSQLEALRLETVRGDQAPAIEGVVI